MKATIVGAGIYGAVLFFGWNPPEQVLLDFKHGFDPGQVPARDVTVTLTRSGLRLALGHAEKYPGITLRAPAGNWDLSRFDHVALEVRNFGATEATICCRVDNAGADGANNCNTGTLTIGPGATGCLTVPFRRRAPEPAPTRFFGMRGNPEGWGAAGTLDPAHVVQLLVFARQPVVDQVVEISEIRAGGRSNAPPPLNPRQPFLPFIDTFGQYVHRDWPGKTHSVDDLQQQARAEQRELAAQPGPRDWDKFGGWQAGPTLAATGFFRVTKYAGRWWLVDPVGKLFFSHGVNGVGALDVTPTDGRLEWFQNFPGAQPDLQAFVAPHQFALLGDYAGKNPTCFGFAAANLFRKYGADWAKVAAQLAQRRLRSWGLNTMANWSKPNVYRLRQTPYIVAIACGGRMLEGSAGYWGKFRDVFDPEFRTKLTERMGLELGKSVADPWCIGYCVDNEMTWGDDTSLAVAALLSPAGQPAKNVFLADLQAKYQTIEQLNAVWGTRYESWAALLAARVAPDAIRARADLTAFYTKTAEQYFRTVKEVVKEIAPMQLNLGCRFASVNPLAAAAAAKFCDVLSFNLYRRSLAGFQIPGGADVPLISTEFHFGALDRGAFHPGLVAVANEAGRAEAYTEYLHSALRHSQFVGCHWFEYQDEPVTGRVLDGENYHVGLVDVADTPYRETVAASRRVGATLYRYRCGE